MLLPFHGSLCTILGPPVVKGNSRVPPTAAPLALARPGLRTNRQRRSVGGVGVKSKTQLRASSQRPWPLTGLSWVKGAGSQGSPKATIGTLKRARTAGGAFTLPVGVKDSTWGGAAVTDRLAANSTHSKLDPNRP